jgi:hypothetical protein
MTINIDDVRKVEEKRRKAKKEMYTKMYDMFSKKIQVAVDHHQKSVVLNIPAFMFGYPKYNMSSARKYMERQLTLSGFSIYRIMDNGIFVTWVKEEKLHYSAPPPTTTKNSDMQCAEDSTIPDLVNLRKLANKYRA